jgi:DNA-binding Lrp family transcriptional regulator
VSRDDYGPEDGFGGDTYEPDRDRERLARQLRAVRVLMADGSGRTLREVSAAVGAPEASVSARLRDLRKARFGAYTVERRHVERGLFEYRVTAPA